jgi:hypothetical protein
MKDLIAMCIGVILVAGCNSGGNVPVEPSQPSDPPGTKRLSKSESHSQTKKSKLTEERSSRK